MANESTFSILTDNRNQRKPFFSTPGRWRAGGLAQLATRPPVAFGQLRPSHRRQTRANQPEPADGWNSSPLATVVGAGNRLETSQPA